MNIIVTNNVKDFPEMCINRFDIEVNDADTFVSNLIDLDRDKSIEALDVKSLKNPQQTKETILTTLEKCGLAGAVTKLR